MKNAQDKENMISTEDSDLIALVKTRNNKTNEECLSCIDIGTTLKFVNPKCFSGLKTKKLEKPITVKFGNNKREIYNKVCGISIYFHEANPHTYYNIEGAVSNTLPVPLTLRQFFLKENKVKVYYEEDKMEIGGETIPFIRQNSGSKPLKTETINEMNGKSNICTKLVIYEDTENEALKRIESFIEQYKKHLSTRLELFLDIKHEIKIEKLENFEKKRIKPYRFSDADLDLLENDISSLLEQKII